MVQDQGIGREVKRLREERGWSQAKLAVEAEMSVSGVSMIENGQRNLTTTTLAKLARAFSLEIPDLFPKAQAPLPLEDEKRGPFDFKEAREGLERYCERWEQILAENGLDDRAVEEFFATADGWIAVLDVAVRAEIDELHRATGLVGSELFAESEIRRANLRYQDVFSGFVEVLRRGHGKIPADPTSAGANVVRLQEVRERLVGMQNEAVG